MSWHFSRALVEAYLEANCSTGQQCVQLNATNMLETCLWHGKMTDACNHSQFGMTLELSMERHGKELLMWFLEAFRARTFQQQEKELESKESEAVCGPKWRALLVKFDPNTSGWKTVRGLWEEDLHWSCVILPRWGSLHDGELWERVTLALRTSEKGFGYLPTPCRYGNGGTSNTRKWEALGVNRHKMNPSHQEWLMGWPVGWTELTAPVTAKFRKWLSLHGTY
jgi:hypothetical protein